MSTHHKAHNVVVVGASAGGVEALQTLFSALDPQLDACFLVVMHIPTQPQSNLHLILSRATAMPVIAAHEDQPLRAGAVYVATADRHLMLDERGVRVTRGPRECRVRPAIDVLFRSAAVTHGKRVIGVVLSGALDDGTAGLWAIKDCNGLALVQDPVEAPHSSMPRSAIEHVAVDFVGSLQQLAEQINALVRAEAPAAQTDAAAVNEHYFIENQISLTGKGLEAGVFRLGKVSRYSCPDCHGVLVEIKEGPITRFRCHTGHAYSVKTLISAVNDSIDTALWDTLRALEERILLLRQMADLAGKAGNAGDAADCLRQAERAEARLQPLRELVLDPQMFGSNEAG
ncbi:chemotaxis protein CheB [Pseudomonas sp. RIT-PI-S]|uniref:chemotaxis protein CheB n=1 Tax=Pseudomonas sp. RIT-PI-S TaxID=3035295 RepID=UPI0021DB0EF1|nr:chemotaxis protein CheB [Pseudomonas sp. RIT-PI-S]